MKIDLKIAVRVPSLMEARLTLSRCLVFGQILLFSLTLLVLGLDPKPAAADQRHGRKNQAATPSSKKDCADLLLGGNGTLALSLENKVGLVIRVKKELVRKLNYGDLTSPQLIQSFWLEGWPEILNVARTKGMTVVGLFAGVLNDFLDHLRIVVDYKDDDPRISPHQIKFVEVRREFDQTKKLLSWAEQLRSEGPPTKKEMEGIAVLMEALHSLGLSCAALRFYSNVDPVFNPLLHLDKSQVVKLMECFSNQFEDVVVGIAVGLGDERSGPMGQPGNRSDRKANLEQAEQVSQAHKVENKIGDDVDDDVGDDVEGITVERASSPDLYGQGTSDSGARDSKPAEPGFGFRGQHPREVSTHQKNSGTHPNPSRPVEEFSEPDNSLAHLLGNHSELAPEIPYFYKTVRGDRREVIVDKALYNILLTDKKRALERYFWPLLKSLTTGNNRAGIQTLSGGFPRNVVEVKAYTDTHARLFGCLNGAQLTVKVLVRNIEHKNGYGLKRLKNICNKDKPGKLSGGPQKGSL